jgi:hypothetical protein
MKSELTKRNAVLFIVGYSGADDDVNEVLSDSISNGLTVYWLKHSNSDTGVGNLGFDIKTIDPVSDNGSFQDSTKTLATILSAVIT